MPFVLDASIAACWAFEDEDHPRAALALERIRTDEARVPGLWWFEVRNVLLVNERRGRISEVGTAGFLRDLSRLGVTLDRSPDEAALLSLARRYRRPSTTAGRPMAPHAGAGWPLLHDTGYLSAGPIRSK